MKIYYDTESDYLEIVFGKPTECDYVKIGLDTYKRVDINTGQIKGYAIFNVKKSDSPLKAINIDLPEGIIDSVK